MATNRNPRQNAVPMKQSNASANRETRPRRSKRRRDEFRGPITGFIDVARNRGDVVSYSENVHMDAEGDMEPTQHPSPRHQVHEQDRNYAEEDAEFEYESESSDDDGRGGAVFLGPISGFVREDRDAISLNKVTYVPRSEKNLLNESRRAYPPRVRSQPESEIMESRNIIQNLNSEPVMCRANNIPRTRERQYAQNWADSPEFDMDALTKEFHKLSPEMRRFVDNWGKDSSIDSQSRGPNSRVPPRLIPEQEDNIADGWDDIQNLNREPSREPITIRRNVAGSLNEKALRPVNTVTVQAIGELSTALQDKIVTTSFILGAKGPLKHAKERQADIEKTFSRWHISSSDYAILAGFSESVIQLGIGYLQEIHIFIFVDIPLDDLLISDLGKIFSPCPGILFTPSSSYQTPVYRDDGTIWDWDELVFSRTERYSDMCATGMNPDAVISSVGRPPSNSFGRSVSAGVGLKDEGSSGAGTGNKGSIAGGMGDKGSGGGGMGDKGKGVDKDHEDRNSKDKTWGNGDPNGGDPEDPDLPAAANSSTPAFSFDIQAHLYVDTSSRIFQALKVKGKVTTRSDVKPKLYSKSFLEFTQLEFQGDRESPNGYEQIHIRVEIDAKQELADINVIKPIQTRASDRETKEIKGTKQTSAVTLGGAVGFIKPTATVSLSGSRANEASLSTEVKVFGSRVKQGDNDGVVWWEFLVDDAYEREQGMKFQEDALPDVAFEFIGESDGAPPPPPPDHFRVLIASCWSLTRISSSNNWLQWFKAMLQSESTEMPSYSNLCQIVVLELPYHLSEKSHYKSVTQVKDSSSQTTVKRDSSHNVIPAILFLDHTIHAGEFGNSHSLQVLPTLRQKRIPEGELQPVLAATHDDKNVLQRCT